MKRFLILLLLSLNVSASYVQLGTGGLTPHINKGEKLNYCNQWNNTGIIANKSYYLRFSAGRWGLTYMQGNDSICSDIEGLFVHYLFTADRWWETGLTIGGYSFEMSNSDRAKFCLKNQVESIKNKVLMSNLIFSSIFRFLLVYRFQWQFSLFPIRITR